MAYTAYAPMIEAGRASPALWRLLSGVITILIFSLIWLAAIVGVLAIALRVHPLDAAFFAFGGPANSPSRSVFYLWVIAGLGLATLVSAALWQGRRWSDLVGYGPRVLRHFMLAAGVTLSLAFLLTGLQYGFSDEPLPARNLDFSTWIAWVPFALLALVFQTGAEELFFRGYLQSQLAGRFRAPIVWLVVPSVAFGFAHFAPGLPGANSWFYVGFAVLFGILAADLTARTGSLGAAWGWHFANNCFAVLFVATEGSMTGLGLWRASGGLLEPIALSPLLLLDIAVLLGIWFAIRRILSV